MKGPVETKTRRKIMRKGVDNPIDVTIVREIIRVRPVSYHTDGGDIRYIRVTTVHEQTTDGLKKAIADIGKEIPQDTLAAYVVDLRNHPGSLRGPGRTASITFMP